MLQRLILIFCVLGGAHVLVGISSGFTASAAPFLRHTAPGLLAKNEKGSDPTKDGTRKHHDAAKKNKDAAKKTSKKKLVRVRKSRGRTATSKGTAPAILSHYAFAMAEYESLGQLWANLKSYLDLEDIERTVGEVSRIRQESLRLGVHNLFAMTVVMLRYARDFSEKDRHRDAIRLALAAQRLSPDLPHGHFALARLYWSQSKLSLGKIISEYARGVQKLWGHLPSRIITAVNLLAVLWATFLIIALIFLLVSLFHHLGFLTHDAHHWAKGSLPKLQLGVLVIATIMLPLLLGMGLLFTLLLALALISLYQRGAALLVSLLIVVVVIAVLPATNYFLNAAAYLSRPEADLYQCNYAICDQTALQRLKKDNKKRDSDTLATLAVVQIRRHNYGAAEKLLRAAESGTSVDPAVQTNLGTVLWLMGKQPGSLEAFDRALTMAPKYLPALFNKSQCLKSLSQLDKAKAAIATAEGQDVDWVTTQRKIAEKMPALIIGTQTMPYLVHAPLSATRLAKRLLFAGDTPPIRGLPFPDLMLGNLDRNTAFWCFVGLFVLLMLLRLFKRRIALAAACSNCSSPTCRSCLQNAVNPKEGEEPLPLLCDRCASAKSGDLTAKKAWLEEKRIEHMRGRAERFRNYATFVLPGLTQLLARRTVSGVFFSTLFVFSLVQIIGWRGFLRDEWLLDNKMPLATLTAHVCILLIVYLSSLLDVFIRARRGSR